MVPEGGHPDNRLPLHPDGISARFRRNGQDLQDSPLGSTHTAYASLRPLDRLSPLVVSRKRSLMRSTTVAARAQRQLYLEEFM